MLASVRRPNLRFVNATSPYAQGGPTVFVTVFTYRAKAGEEDAVVALHEDWQRTRRDKAPGLLPG
jgi:hypothetical protein